MNSPPGSGPSAIWTWPKSASTPGATSTTAGSRTCPRRGAGRPGPAGPRPGGRAGPAGRARRGAPGRVRGPRRVEYRDLELHRRNPLLHLAELDLACYDREYAPAGERSAARLSAAGRVAAGGGRRAGLARSGQRAGGGRAAERDPRAGRRHPGRRAAAGGRGGAGRARTAGARTWPGGHRGRSGPGAGRGRAGRADGQRRGHRPSTWASWPERADAERDRLLARLAEDCARIDGSRPPLELCRELVRDHPGPDEVIGAAEQWTSQAIEFTRDRDLVPYHDGVCLVGPGAGVAPLGDGDDVSPRRPVSRTRRPGST